MDKNALIEQYKILHTTKKYGRSSIKLLKLIKKIIDFKPESILDYGCGQSKLLDYLKAKRRYRYDPAIKKYIQLPKTKVDLVLCIDVLEHILEEDLDNVLKELKSLSNKVIFSIGTKLATHKLPNGLNAHITVKPKKWWIKKLSKYFNTVNFCIQLKAKFMVKEMRVGERFFYDEEGYCGEPDFSGIPDFEGAKKIPTIFDVKRTPDKIKNGLQLSAYCKKYGVEQGIIVPLSDKNQQGYSKPLIFGEKELGGFFKVFKNKQEAFKKRYGV